MSQIDKNPHPPISNNVQEVSNLLQEKNTIETNIFESEAKIRVLKEQVKNINKELFHKCNHKWKYDNGCAFDDHTKYFCEICGVWRNSYWYTS
jgi:hypothetical protein